MIATGLAGLVFNAARRRAGHLAAPAAIHWSINVAGAAIPWVRGRLD